MSPYRTPHAPLGRRAETFSTMKRLAGVKNDPLFDSIPDEKAVAERAILDLFERISYIVTDWYTSFLMREVRDASDYEEAVTPASLLAFSLKPHCIDKLGGLLFSGEPLLVLVAVETLSDVVALGPEGPTRTKAYLYLRATDLPLAHAELDEAVAFSRLGHPRLPEAPVFGISQVPCSGFYFVPHK